MIVGPSLLERVQRPDLPPATDGSAATSAVLESVVANLGRIFNTRRDDSTARPDYGLTDFNDMVMQFPHALPVIARSIRHQIQEFEPRLQNPVVRPLQNPDSPLALTFTISARLLVGDRSERISVETVLNDDGRAVVRF